MLLLIKKHKNIGAMWTHGLAHLSSLAPPSAITAKTDSRKTERIFETIGGNNVILVATLP